MRRGFVIPEQGKALLQIVCPRDWEIPRGRASNGTKVNTIPSWDILFVFEFVR